jgi:ABC-type lipoprotein export system ATPase subunit
MSNDTKTALPSTITASIEHVSKYFPSGGGQVKAVDDVSFILPRGKLVALRGPSGCGKSTLLNLLGTLDKPNSGAIIVDGVDLTRLSGGREVDFRRRKVGFVFQMFNLMPHLSALENVTLPMGLAGIKNGNLQTRAQALLGRVGLPEDRWVRRPFKLSGGEQQRVAIARALANEPPLILADEPTANLDSKTGALIIQLLRDLANENRTVLIATHDDAIARQADIVFEMQDGHMVSTVGGLESATADSWRSDGMTTSVAEVLGR